MIFLRSARPQGRRCEEALGERAKRWKLRLYANESKKKPAPREL